MQGITGLDIIQENQSDVDIVEPLNMGKCSYKCFGLHLLAEHGARDPLVTCFPGGPSHIRGLRVQRRPSLPPMVHNPEATLDVKIGLDRTVGF